MTNEGWYKQTSITLMAVLFALVTAYFTMTGDGAAALARVSERLTRVEEAIVYFREFTKEMKDYVREERKHHEQEHRERETP